MYAQGALCSSVCRGLPLLSDCPSCLRTLVVSTMTWRWGDHPNHANKGTHQPVPLSSNMATFPTVLKEGLQETGNTETLL
uniref:Uncharacterized protein n=1 Tax=Timema bartmani TaxID=61472 RepID=A0A7R9I8A3_9NEOP|nr:unnamed protein product [Timema bartmani]